MLTWANRNIYRRRKRDQEEFIWIFFIRIVSSTQIEKKNCKNKEHAISIWYNDDNRINWHGAEERKRDPAES